MSENKPNALATIKAGNRGVQLATVADMRETAAIMVQSKMLPAGYENPSQVFVGLQYGAELGLRPMTAINSIAVIRGKPTLWGDAALGMVKSCGLLTKFSEKVTGVGKAMVAEVMSEREDKFTVETTFSVEDAITAGLWGKTGPWKTHPKRMLKYKARAFNLRDNFPDILKGLHLQEEMVGEEDIAHEPLEKPTCDVAPRDERRKKVVSQDSPPLEKPVEDVPPNASAGVFESKTEAPHQSAEVDSPVGSADVLDAEVIMPVEEQLDSLMAAYEAAGGTDFTEWAAEALCRGEDEVSEASDFTDMMITQLRVHLDQNGVE
jgi:hypothetical protein